MKREGRRGEGLVGLEQKKNFKLKTVCKQIEVCLLQVFTWRVEKYKRKGCELSAAYVMANMNIQKRKLSK